MSTQQSLYGDEIGAVIGESSPSTILFIVNNRKNIKPRLGEYVIVDYGEDAPSNERYVLGMIENIICGNPLVPDELDNPNIIERLRVFEESTRRTYLKGVARLLSFVDTLLSKKPKVVTPKYPPPPLSKVYRASNHLLKSVFSKNDRGWIRIGVLASHPQVPYSVNVNMIVQRHLAILAVTGAGKSNTVALITSRIVDELNGTVLIFDMHSEYVYSNLSSKMNIIQPVLNPIYMHPQELQQLLRIPANAWRQERLFREALQATRKAIFDKENPQPYDKFFELLKENISKAARSLGKEWGDVAHSVEIKVDDLLDRYGHVFKYDVSSDLTEIIRPGYLNIMDLGEIDEETADVVVSHYLRRIYYERKKNVINSSEGYPDPVVLVLEEAHILIPRNDNTLSKYWIARIAREGRKFGIGLVLVSQRPKVIDENALSQTNNKIILRLVEPSDLRYVQSASEYLSDELLKILPSLNVGEAIVIGLMSPLPAIIKIDECIGKKGGRDINAVEKWLKKERAVEEGLKLASDIMGF